MHKTVLIAGGTGLVGGHLIKLLVESDECDEIKVLVRKGSNYRHKGVSVIDLDYDHLADIQEDLKADSVFCCLGTTMKKAGSREQFYKVDFSYPFELAKLSLRNGSQQFNIITASGANSKSMFYYNKVKGKVETALCELEFQNINIFRPSLLLGHRREQRIGEQFGASLAKVINPMLIGGIKKYRAIQAEVVARAMINVSGRHMKGIHVLQSDVIQEFGQI